MRKSGPCGTPMSLGRDSLRLIAAVLLADLALPCRMLAQAVAQGSPPPPGLKVTKCHDRPIPQLEDITDKAGIHFLHSSAPENRYIVESMSGGVLLLDYDSDGLM